MMYHAFLPWLIRRWWFWAVVPVALLPFVAVTLNVMGEIAWGREQSAAQAMGLPTSWSAFVAAAPAVDVMRQEQLWRLGLRWRDEPGDQVRGSPLTATWSEIGSPTVADRGTSAGAAQRTADLAELSAILDAGPVVWGELGWMRQDGVNPTALAGGGGNMRGYPLSGLSAARAYAAQALAAPAGALPREPVALLAANVDALRHLAQVLLAHRGASSPWDVESYGALAQSRDAVYLRLLAERRLAPAAAQAWVHEPDATLAVAIDALRSQRLTECHDGETDDWEMRWDWDQGEWTCAQVATYAVGKILRAQRRAVWSQRCRALIVMLGGGPVPSDLGSWLHERSRRGAKRWFERSPGDSAFRECNPCADLFATAQRGLADANRHRLIRAAAQAITAWNAGALPANDDTTTIDRDVLAGTDLLPPLVYERLSPTRFRLSIDPRAPLNPLLPTSRPEPLARFGHPAAEEPLVDDDWWLELDCAACPSRTPGGGAAAASAVGGQ